MDGRGCEGRAVRLCRIAGHGSSTREQYAGTTLKPIADRPTDLPDRIRGSEQKLHYQILSINQSINQSNLLNKGTIRPLTLQVTSNTKKPTDLHLGFPITDFYVVFSLIFLSFIDSVAFCQL